MIDKETAGFRLQLAITLSGLGPILKAHGAMVAGGAILSLMEDRPVNDIDIFFTSKEAVEEALEEAKKLDGFESTATNEGMFLTSYIKSTFFKKDYEGTKWIGRSHKSGTPGIVRHSFGWIQTECAKRGMIANEIKEKAYNFGNQTWIRIKHKAI